MVLNTLKALETARLSFRQLNTGDAAFILQLVNEPAWLHLLNGPMAMYPRLGFGPWLVESKEKEALGICGLIKREQLADIDLGFAFLSAHHRRGYAFEAATATLAYARTALGFARVVAVVSPDNEASRRLLEKLGFRWERLTCLAENTPAVELYAMDL